MYVPRLPQPSDLRHLSSFFSFAEVTLALRNKGEDAFKADQYGKMIYITRRIQAAGGSSYKIANFEKKVVTTQRSEVAAICDHFMIQMENPVNVSWVVRCLRIRILGAVADPARAYAHTRSIRPALRLADPESRHG